MQTHSIRDIAILTICAGAIVCWLFAAYYNLKFQTHFGPIMRAGQLPKGLSPRMALFWADYPPICGVLRRKALKWAGGFCFLLFVAVAVRVIFPG